MGWASGGGTGEGAPRAVASPVSPLGPSFDSEKAGDREVQRTMLELLNQLDGFQPNTQVKVSVVFTGEEGALRSGISCRFTGAAQVRGGLEYPVPSHLTRAASLPVGAVPVASL